MNNAKKLRLPISAQAFDKAGKVIDRHAFTADAPQGRLVRKYAPKKQIEMFKQILPETLKPHLLTINYSEIHLLKAHVHIPDEAVINFYQQTGGEVTTFWDGLIERDDDFTLDNGNNYFTLRHNNLTPSEAFVAKDGEIWLLNTKKPHSVSTPYETRPRARHFVMQPESQPRYVVQAFFDIPFLEISKILEDAQLTIDEAVVL